MLHLESDIKTLHTTQEKAYDFMADFSNLSDLARREDISNWQAVPESCSFEVRHAGLVSLHFVDKQPHKTLKTEGETNGIGFNLWIQLKQDQQQQTRMKVTVKANIPAMMQGMAKKPLQSFLDMLADNLSYAINEPSVN